ncbi:hypothetical protein K469DRAFT_791150 [Zopfia rhizophila CBS 207.26]|uniref:Uncharacterized protein n=1 Tax=Zopfia rhizophila CBS 207.26 TaxID=1314779 RepID=A0A6A6DRY0_9PEZI|nr:hypothetical protein K469DRAFT_791150 [Zopfia rhizophila CBS 207.26]
MSHTSISTSISSAFIFIYIFLQIHNFITIVHIAHHTSSKCQNAKVARQAAEDQPLQPPLSTS